MKARNFSSSAALIQAFSPSRPEMELRKPDGKESRAWVLVWERFPRHRISQQLCEGLRQILSEGLEIVYNTVYINIFLLGLRVCAGNLTENGIHLSDARSHRLKSMKYVDCKSEKLFREYRVDLFNSLLLSLSLSLFLLFLMGVLGISSIREIKFDTVFLRLPRLLLQNVRLGKPLTLSGHEQFFFKYTLSQD